MVVMAANLRIGQTSTGTRGRRVLLGLTVSDAACISVEVPHRRLMFCKIDAGGVLIGQGLDLCSTDH